MRATNKNKAALGLLLFGFVVLAAGSLPAQEEEAVDPLIAMIVELVSDSDRDMRALGLQQIREEVPGEAATKQFAELLSKLPPEGQTGLLEALGDRQDATARPAVLKMLEAEDESVRAAALGAVGSLGGSADVPLLSGKAAEGSEAEKAAARQSLVRLRGDDVNGAIVAAVAEAAPAAKAELIGSLAARNATEALPTVLEGTKDAESVVRLAALRALRFIADEDDTTAIVDALKATGEESERQAAKLALLTVCGHGGPKCSDALIAAAADADVPARLVILSALARSGGPKALEAVGAMLENDDQAVRDEAMRMLSIWPDAAAAGQLSAIAKQSKELRHQVLAIRGLVRLSTGDEPADVETLTEAMKAATRPQEKLLVLGAASSAATQPALDLAVSVLDNAELSAEAGLAAVMIAERIEGPDKAKIRTALEKVAKAVKDQKTADRAKKVIESL